MSFSVVSACHGSECMVCKVVVVYIVAFGILDMMRAVSCDYGGAWIISTCGQ